MRFILVSLLMVSALPLAFAQKREVVELQRDVSLLQDQVRSLQRSQDEKIAALQVLIQQTLDNVAKTNTSVAVLANQLQGAMKEQQTSVSAPVAGLGAKIDQMAEDFRAVRESVLDMNSRIGKLDAKLSDLQNAITISKNPAPPPTGAGVSTAPPTISSGPPAGMQADAMYTNAYRDYQGGNYDLAIQEFSDYVKYYNQTQYAPNAQFYIGDIYLRKSDFENAVQAFDAVLEKYSENNKTPDAHYMKGIALLRQNKRDAAAREFREVASRYPNSDVAPKAQQQLRQLGLSAGSATRSRSKRR